MGKNWDTETADKCRLPELDPDICDSCRDYRYCHRQMTFEEEEKDCERCLQVTERPGNDICKACGGRRGQDATRMEESDLRDLRE